MICPGCGFTNIAGADECEDCGHALSSFDIEPSAVSGGFSAAQTPLREVPAPATIMVPPATPLSEVVDRLISATASCVLVVSGGRLVGIFSERDLLCRVGASYPALRTRPISDFMTPEPESLNSDATVAWALNRMNVGGFRHIPVVDNSVPVRVLAVRDLLGFLANEYCARA